MPESHLQYVWAADQGNLTVSVSTTEDKGLSLNKTEKEQFYLNANFSLHYKSNETLLMAVTTVNQSFSVSCAKKPGIMRGI